MKDFGRIIDVDLGDGTIREYPFPVETAKEVLGGLGFCLKTILSCVPGDADPLGPENVMVVSPGLLTGSGAPCSARFHICARSPQSGLVGSSNAGGFFGARMFLLNIRAIVLRGTSPEPVRLHLEANGWQLVSAKGLWGLDTIETRKRLQEELDDPKLETLVIGPAGEKLVPFACVMAGRDHAAGRNGLGAVMGSKRLKAISIETVKKTSSTRPENIDIVAEYVKSLRANKERFEAFSRLGSSADIVELNEFGLLGGRNYQLGWVDGAEQIDGSRLKTFVKRKISCHKCPVHCKAEIEISENRHKGFKGVRPEYETVINMGSLCGLIAPDELLYLSNLCNSLGLDTISTGSVIAFAMELFQRGIVDLRDTGGLDLSWGNADSMETLMNEIADREGFGGVLAAGTKKAAEQIGKGAERYAYQVKGVEIYGADPRGLYGTALAYAVSLRGGDFTSVYPVAEFRFTPERAKEMFDSEKAVEFSATEGKGAMIRFSMIVSAVLDSLGLCKVATLSIGSHFDLKKEARLASAFSGIELTPEELMHIGERIVNLGKLFNLRCGAVSELDALPEKFTDEPIVDGPSKGSTVRLAPMIADFYKCMGWDEQGEPLPETLRSLDIEMEKESI